jgi:hypothetical protein
MFIRLLKSASRKLAITTFTLLEVLGLPRESKERSEGES